MIDMILIGLNGFKHSGKNTAASYIEGWGKTHGLGVVQRGFADLLKLSAARSLGIYGAQNINDAVVLMDSLKETGIIDISIPDQSILKSISGREFLKWYGTEGHRDVFSDTFWVDQILPLPPDDWQLYWQIREDVPADIAVVTDCRFANEARRIKYLGGHVIHIDRGYDADDHASEQPLPKHLVDFTIQNKSSLEAFEVQVNIFMNNHYLKMKTP